VARRCDLSRADEIRSAFDEVLKTWGGIDILVNNAGIMYYGATENISDQQWAEVLAINLTAPIMLTRLFLPSLLERHDAHILNVCSIYGLVPKRRLAAYQTAKFALVGFSQSFALGIWATRVGYYALCPGLVRTDLIGAAEKSGRLKNRLTLASHLAVAPEIVALRAVQGDSKGSRDLSWLLCMPAPCGSSIAAFLGCWTVGNIGNGGQGDERRATTQFAGSGANRRLSAVKFCGVASRTSKATLKRLASPLIPWVLGAEE
jgi:short-subunit dehydrogenase